LNKNIVIYKFIFFVALSQVPKIKQKPKNSYSEED